MAEIRLGALTIYGYGLAVAAAAVLGLVFAARNCRRNGIAPDALSWFAVLAIPMGVLGARLLYYIACLKFDFAGFFDFTDGGFTLYGAMGGAVLAAVIAARLTGEKPARLLDQLAAPAALTIGFSRLAEGLVGQGYGWYVADWFDPEMGMSLVHLEDYSFFERFPFAIMDMYEEWSWAIFVWEALVAFALCIVLLKTPARRAGWRAMLFAVMYASLQALNEGLRQDAVLRWGFVRINQVISAVVIAALLAVCCIKLPRPRSVKKIIGAWIGVVASMGVVMAMEFALEKKIMFLEWMPMDLCYVVMFAACIGMIFAFRSVWKTSGVTEG
ncbi:MAG: prolipoprotein diacylglyceryl transferase [Clostridia bacterium]|nr:prolipoprotein diacylglyceryl transferase [Clostridia bacterium]